MIYALSFLKDASDDEPQISGERELKNLGHRKNTVCNLDNNKIKINLI